MSDFIWPATFFATTSVVSFILRAPLADLIQRIKGVSREGFHTGDDRSRVARLDSNPSDQVATLRQDHLEEIKRIAQAHEDREDKTIQPLQRAVEHLAKQVAELDQRISTIENNRVIKPMLAAPPLKSASK